MLTEQEKLYAGILSNLSPTNPMDDLLLEEIIDLPTTNIKPLIDIPTILSDIDTSIVNLENIKHIIQEYSDKITDDSYMEKYPVLKEFISMYNIDCNSSLLLKETKQMLLLEQTHSNNECYFFTQRKENIDSYIHRDLTGISNTIDISKGAKIIMISEDIGQITFNNKTFFISLDFDLHISMGILI